MAETIQPVSITRETRERYLRYALSVITSRALPDVRDGLKPVQRRILYTMYNDLRLYSDAKPRKCAKIVGDVTGNYHPHGGAAAYEALVRLAQDWVMLVPLVRGHGNFGSVDGDPPAADRYTEANLTPIADALMSELKQETVEFRPNYDNTQTEPIVLPAQFPNMLVNGCAGIAVGMATNVPPHNLAETIKAAVHLIENPEADTPALMKFIKGPDFPLGGKIIADKASLRKIYETGSGSIRIQGEWKLEDVGRKQFLVITSIPYGVDKGKLESDMGAIIGDRKLPQVLSLSNESNEKDGLRIAMEIKPGSDPQVILAYFYKHTSLQENFAYNLTCLVPGVDGKLKPEQLGLKPILQHFLTFRLETVRKRFEFELAALRRRIHILEGFRIVFNALDEAIRIIRGSTGKSDAAEKLIARFQLDIDQVTAILDAQLYKLATMEIQKILDELAEKQAAAAKIEAILSSETNLWGVVKSEMLALAEKYGNRRRSKMAGEEDVPEFDPEAYIVRENTNVVLTRDGWIKRVGRLTSVESTRVREGDEVLAVVPGSTLDHVVFLADDGTAYTMRINEIPVSSGYGEPISKFFKIADQVKIIQALPTDERFVPTELPPTNPEEPAGPYLLVATAHGYTLRTPFSAFRTASTKSGRKYARLADDDHVVLAQVIHGETGLMLAATSGHVIHFPIDSVSILAGVGRGVIGIRMDAGIRCLGGALIGNRHDALVVETTNGKTIELRRGAHPTINRGGKGTEVVKRSKLQRVVTPPIELPAWDKVDEKPDPKSREAERANDKAIDRPRLHSPDATPPDETE
ncbi:DNA gyrase/topoisomerase IV subunit A [Tuwongella immobilis]|uniref:DNA topoisomerase (ATP-hydrolyzing) n=1 Tax=Tuwongella immobilis TaxID=692036 RepID=A0A6C2YMF4_9BACT|nr:DNA topoisomerase IV subunit A [Tuwongella immobilis]VIP02303.1 dna topoisomerase : DNA topoisomerase (ATP-hydrolyzing) OS=uncultured planctomycete GN=HGMM_F22C11C08 PE=4 SV=1: DNA_topoisoIV: DNA_gyraseA_C: DNA_gyraseA_C [Tuwongella immobilis]VTS00995.1 dna topoisomerase : DNA topoisomerase (ATP-hydrolyzing) OS=uncultured planctomycete GN=HGMM_F22C11C08 PE=4 SV=1: DNA_topoisoIV: DNA_gyraseA_C: DNA_gyraseA_C [Tuwongella immobilis]